MRNLKLKFDHLNLNQQLANDRESMKTHFFPRREKNDDVGLNDGKRTNKDGKVSHRRIDNHSNGNFNRNNKEKGTFDLALWIQQGSLCTVGSKVEKGSSSSYQVPKQGVDRDHVLNRNQRPRNLSISSNTYSTEENSSLNDSFDSLNESYESATLSVDDFKWDHHYRHGCNYDWLPSRLPSHRGMFDFNCLHVQCWFDSNLKNISVDLELGIGSFYVQNSININDTTQTLTIPT